MRKGKRKIVPSYVFRKISGVKMKPQCAGCGKRFVTTHSAKRYCDACVKRNE